MVTVILHEALGVGETYAIGVRVSQDNDNEAMCRWRLKTISGNLCASSVLEWLRLGTLIATTAGESCKSITGNRSFLRQNPP
jgi:hypothetical protein